MDLNHVKVKRMDELKQENKDPEYIQKAAQ